MPRYQQPRYRVPLMRSPETRETMRRAHAMSPRVSKPRRRYEIALDLLVRFGKVDYVANGVHEAAIGRFLNSLAYGELADPSRVGEEREAILFAAEHIEALRDYFRDDRARKSEMIPAAQMKTPTTVAAVPASVFNIDQNTNDNDDLRASPGYGNPKRARSRESV